MRDAGARYEHHHLAVARSESELEYNVRELRTHIRDRGKELVDVLRALESRYEVSGDQDYKDLQLSLEALREDARTHATRLEDLFRRADPERVERPSEMEELASEFLRLGEQTDLRRVREAGSSVVGKILTLAATRLGEWKAKRRLLQQARERAQWFLHADEKGARFAPSELTGGVTPFIHAEHELYPTRNIKFLIKRADGSLEKNRYPPKLCRKCGDFMVYAHNQRIEHLEYRFDKPEKIEEQKLQMVQALVAALNREMPGLALAEKDVRIDWLTTDQHTLNNGTRASHFAAESLQTGMTIEISMPAQPPGGLEGRDDMRYAEYVKRVEEVFLSQ